MKKIVIASAAILLVIAVVIWGMNIQSTKEHDKEVQEQTAATDAADAKKVTMSISCAQVLDHYDELDESLKDEKYVPKDGMILPAAAIQPASSRMNNRNKSIRPKEGGAMRRISSGCGGCASAGVSCASVCSASGVRVCTFSADCACI